MTFPTSVQTAYDITRGVFNTLGTVTVIAGMVGPKVFQKIAQRGGVTYSTLHLEDILESILSFDLRQL